MRRREVVLGAGALFATASSPRAEARRAMQVGVLHPGPAPAMSLRVPVFRDGFLAAAGRSDGEVGIVTRVMEGAVDQLPGLASRLVASGVEAILAVSPPAVHAARAATAAVPIIAIDLESDPVANGWAESLARPGGNLTGLFLDLPDLSVKCLELLREIVAPTRKVTIIWDPATGPVPLEAVSRATAILDLAFEVVAVSRLNEIEKAFDRFGQARPDGLLMLSSPVVGGNPQRVAALALAHRLPAITLFAEFAQSGGLISYGPDITVMYRQAGALARKLMQGQSPAEIPIERPARFQLVANLRTAKAIGATLPTSILLRADEVIE